MHTHAFTHARTHTQISGLAIFCNLFCLVNFAKRSQKTNRSLLQVRLTVTETFPHKLDQHFKLK